MTLGFGVSALYGLKTEYDRGWIGRYHAVKSELTTININPALGFKINDQLSFGIGISAQYADAELTNALDFGTLGAPLGTLPANPAFDGFTKIQGDDWGFGFNLGVLYQFNEHSRIGLSYRSKVEHTLEGDNELTIPAFATALAGPSRTRDAKADLTTPATISLSAYHRINDRWAIMGDITWTDWSEFEELRIRFDEPGARDSVQPQDWEDAYRFSLGLSYAYNDHWTLRGGIAYDETPVSTDKRTPRIPDNSRRWVTFGASYRPSPTFSFDFAYAHIFVSDTPD